MKRTSKRTLVDDLVYRAMFEATLAADVTGSKIRRARERGSDLPEEAKPGRLIMSLSPEKRELVKTLTTKDFNDRLFC